MMVVMTQLGVDMVDSMGWSKRSGTRRGFSSSRRIMDIMGIMDQVVMVGRKILPTMLGHMYVGTGNNNQNGNQKCSDLLVFKSEVLTSVTWVKKTLKWV